MIDGLDITLETLQGLKIMRRHLNNDFDFFRVNIDTSLRYNET